MSVNILDVLEFSGADATAAEGTAAHSLAMLDIAVRALVLQSKSTRDWIASAAISSSPGAVEQVQQLDAVLAAFKAAQ